MENTEKTVAIVLAAGSGKRMGSEVKKQFLDICGRPILFYCLDVFEKSFIDEVIIVVSKEDETYVRQNIVEKYGFSKVKAYVTGGKERYNSVHNALCAIENTGVKYAFVHDGARPFPDEEMLERALNSVKEDGACVVGMPSKDTVKIATADGFVDYTPDRNTVWNIQTPQVFEYQMILDAYKDIVSREDELKEAGVNITDDAMVLETYSGHRVKLVEGSYDNIKVTTPGDLDIALGIIKKRGY